MEMGSEYARQMVESLMNVHALMNMYRVNDREETRKTAADWIPTLERS